MSIFLSIGAGFVCFLSGFYYGVWFIKRRYFELGKKLLTVVDCDTYSLDFLTGAGVTLNTLFENKLDSNVKLAITKKIIKTRKRNVKNEKQ